MGCDGPFDHEFKEHEATKKQDRCLECICTEYDGRGRSVCGIECPQHPINGECPDCKKAKTHNNRECFNCYAKSENLKKTYSTRQLELADYHLVGCFQALSALRDNHKKDLAPDINQYCLEAIEKRLRKHRDTILEAMSAQRQHEQGLMEKA